MKIKNKAVGALFALTCSFSAAADNGAHSDHSLSDWWHKSVNVVGSYHTRFGPQLNNDVYLEYEVLTRKE